MPAARRPNMPGYGVPSDPAGTLPWAWARERLTANRNYWVGTVDAGGRPHSTPVWGVWHDDDTFWFSCDPGALKARNLAVNPHVVVATDDTVEFVSVEGVATRRPAPAEVARAWARKYDDGTGDGGAADVAEMEAFFAANTTFCMQPVKAIGMIERPDEFAERATRWDF